MQAVSPTQSPAVADSARASARVIGFDVARALAILGMVVVHFSLVLAADRGGPDWLNVLLGFLDGRAAATFVILAGVGITLMSRRAVLGTDPRAVAEGNGLGAAVGELLVVRLGEEQLPPIRGERGILLRQLFGDLLTQQPAEPGGDLGQFCGRLRRDRLPAEEIVKPGDECRRGREFSARRFNVAVQFYNGADEFAILPEAKRVAVRVQQVGQRLQLLSLLLVVALVLARVGAFVGRFDFHEPDEHVSERDGVVRPGLERGESIRRRRRTGRAKTHTAGRDRRRVLRAGRGADLPVRR